MAQPAEKLTANDLWPIARRSSSRALLAKTGSLLASFQDVVQSSSAGPLFEQAARRRS